ELRQAVRPRLPRIDPLEQAATRTVAAGRCRGEDAGEIRRGVPATHRAGAGVMLIGDKLERLIEEMVEKGVRFEDAVREFEKRFIVRVLGQCEGSLIKTADMLGMHRN